MLPDLVDYLAEPLLVHLVVLGHHLVNVCIMHNKVVHIDASRFIDWGLNVCGAKVVSDSSLISSRWFLHVHVCSSCWLLMWLFKLILLDRTLLHHPGPFLVLPTLLYLLLIVILLMLV